MKGGDCCFAIDANVILRYLLTDDDELSPKSISIFQAVRRGELVVHCDPVTIAEVVWVLSSFYKTGREEIGSRVGDLVRAEGFRLVDKALYIRALELYAGPVPHFGDACACATALQRCEGRLLSFDRDLSRVDGIERAESAAAEAGEEGGTRSAC